ncbi:MAG: helix-turn-helix domain-containing protein [Thermoplasmata archaeon]|nr:helix-turn-helix domain-containing protein [Thermoplasmata archaeon]
MRARPPLDVDPKVEGFIGSANRARTLAPIASARQPLTAYRIAWLARVPRSKVYGELRRLKSLGLVAEREDPKGASTWILLDEDAAAYLRKKMRVLWSGDIGRSSEEMARRERSRSRPSFAWFNRSKYQPNPKIAARIAKEVTRPVGKGEFPGMPEDRRSRKNS